MEELKSNVLITTYQRANTMLNSTMKTDAVLQSTLQWRLFKNDFEHVKLKGKDNANNAERARTFIGLIDLLLFTNTDLLMETGQKNTTLTFGMAAWL
jgi:hypothetical protein